MSGASSTIVTYSDIEGGIGEPWFGTGCIDQDPFFLDPVSGDFHLTWDNFPVPDSTRSPCIDSGDPASPQDPDSTRADMGAFHFHQYIGVLERRQIERSAVICHIYPNPFTRETVILFSIPGSCETGDVQLHIYDLAGQVVRSFVLANARTSVTKVTWDGRDDSGETAPSGTYFVRLSAGDFWQAEKLVLLRGVRR
jgi:hypothetical protein